MPIIRNIGDVAGSQKYVNNVISKWVVVGGGGYFEQLWPKLAIDKFIDESMIENPTFATRIQKKYICSPCDVK